MNNEVFILQHNDIQVDGFRVFSSLDRSLECLKEWYEMVEDDLMSFSLMRYKFNEDTTEYEHVEDIDLAEYFSESEEGDESDAVSVIEDDDDSDKDTSE
jgi:hypothetical protein